MFTGHIILDGVPYINGKPALLDENPPVMVNGEPLFSQYRCPECNAHLSAESQICLNACHLSAAAYRRLNTGIMDSYWKNQMQKNTHHG